MRIVCSVRAWPHPFPLSDRRGIVVHGPMLAFSLQKSQSFIRCDTSPLSLSSSGSMFSRKLRIDAIQVCSKPNSGEYYVGVCSGTKDPRDAAGAYLANLPIDGIVLEDPGM